MGFDPPRQNIATSKTHNVQTANVYNPQCQSGQSYDGSMLNHIKLSDCRTPDNAFVTIRSIALALIGVRSYLKKRMSLEFKPPLSLSAVRQRRLISWSLHKKPPSKVVTFVTCAFANSNPFSSGSEAENLSTLTWPLFVSLTVNSSNLKKRITLLV